MAIDIEPALLRGHMHGHQGYRDIDIEQHAAGLAMHVVVSLHPAVVAAGLVRERQLLDQPMLREKVKRAVHRAVPDVWVTAADALENLPGGEVRLRLTDNVQDSGALGCVPKPLTWHHATFRHTR